jgi:hypothetical protein
MVTLMQANPDGAAAAGVMAIFGGFWCCAATAGIGQFVMAIVALVQVLSRPSMSGPDRLLWALISWFIPLIGPILWWTIGSKQFPPPDRPGQ